MYDVFCIECSFKTSDLLDDTKDSSMGRVGTISIKHKSR